MRFFLLLFSFLFCNYLFSQSLTDLNKQKEELLRSIAATNILLEAAKGKHNIEISKIKLLDAKIEDRKKLIALHQKEYSIAINNLKRLNNQLDSVQRDMQSIKDEYAEILYHLSVSKLYNKDFFYILGSGSFNESYRRFLFVQQYNTYRRKQADLLVVKQTQFNALKAKVEERRKVALNSLALVRKEEKELSNELISRQKEVNDLQNQQTRLRKEAQEAQKKADMLENRILAIIRESSKSGVDQKLSTVIIENKGRLPWPVSNGVVVSAYGEHAHPVIKNLKVKNNGIDIQVSGSNKVSTIFDGVVTRLIAIPGYNASVIIRHGSILTVYSNLVNVQVKQDQKVTTGQYIGDVYNGEGSNNGILHFELWNEDVKQNPSIWLK